MRRYSVVFVMMVLIAAGCAQKSVTKTDDQQQQQVQQTADTGKQTKESAETVTDKQLTAKVDSVDSSDASSRKEIEGIFKDVYFDYDKYEVKETFQPVLKSIATWMTKNSGAKLSIEGHCDERGTNEYNLALGDRRAKAVRDALVSLGVASSQIETISYGEEKPACKEQTEDCWARNRRAHFVVLTKAGK